MRSDEALPLLRRRLVQDVALGLWFIACSFIYFRQFVAQGMSFLAKLLGN